LYQSGLKEFVDGWSISMFADPQSALTLVIVDLRDQIRELEQLTAISDHDHDELERLRRLLYRLQMEWEYRAVKQRRDNYCAANPDDQSCRQEDI
jgi:hypothetical protein